MRHSIHLYMMCFYLLVGCGKESTWFVGGAGPDDMKDAPTSEISHRDSFFQNQSNNKVDILWVIDDSGSMGDEQGALGDNFTNFIDTFLLNQTDFRMGITTTGICGQSKCENGEFVGNVPILTSSMDSTSVRNYFIDNVHVGTSGYGVEKGLAAADLAIQLTADPESVNYNFIRDDAFLAVIIVSDENDSSDGGVHALIESIKSIKEDPNHVAVYTIVDTLSTNPVYYGERYMEASEVGGGFAEDIHQDFSMSLLNIGNGIADLINSFTLEYPAIEDSIVVIVNNIPISRDSANGWEFSEIKNSITFNGTAIPIAGANIEVKYSSLAVNEE